jgi:hypothetical protein
VSVRDVDSADADGPVPLLATVDPTACSGPFTSATFDPGDGSAPIPLTIDSSSGSPRLAAFTYNYTSVSYPGYFSASIVLLDASGNSDTATDTVHTVASPDAASTALLQIPYPQVDDDMSVAWGRQVLDILDQAAGNAVPKIATYQSLGDVIEEAWLPGESFPRQRRTLADLFRSDGTFDPLTSTGLFAQAFGSGATPTPPTGTTTFYQPVSADADPTGNVTSRVVTLPGSIPAGSYAIIALDLFAATSNSVGTPAGWTLLDGPTNNPNGNASMRVYGKAVGTADSGTTVTFTAGTGVLQAVVGGVWLAASAVAAHAIAANDGTAQVVHPTPSVTSAQPSQMQIGVAGGRFSVTGPVLFAEPSGSNVRMVDSSASTGKNVGLVLWDNGLRVAQGAGDVGTARSGSGAFSVGWSGVLTHA